MFIEPAKKVRNKQTQWKGGLVCLREILYLLLMLSSLGICYQTSEPKINTNHYIAQRPWAFFMKLYLQEKKRKVKTVDRGLHIVLLHIYFLPCVPATRCDVIFVDGCKRRKKQAQWDRGTEKNWGGGLVSTLWLMWCFLLPFTSVWLATFFFLFISIFLLPLISASIYLNDGLYCCEFSVPARNNKRREEVGMLETHFFI